MAKKVLSDVTAQEVEQKGAGGQQGFWSALAGIFLRRREASILVIAVALIIYFQVSNLNFLSRENIGTLASYTAETAIIAAGEVMLLICGEIDLSAGRVYALAPFIMYFAFQAGIPLV